MIYLLDTNVLAAGLAHRGHGPCQRLDGGHAEHQRFCRLGGGHFQPVPGRTLEPMLEFYVGMAMRYHNTAVLLMAGGRVADRLKPGLEPCRGPDYPRPRFGQVGQAAGGRSRLHPGHCPLGATSTGNLPRSIKQLRTIRLCLSLCPPLCRSGFRILRTFDSNSFNYDKVGDQVSGTGRFKLEIGSTQMSKLQRHARSPLLPHFRPEQPEARQGQTPHQAVQDHGGENKESGRRFTRPEPEENSSRSSQNGFCP